MHSDNTVFFFFVFCIWYFLFNNYKRKEKLLFEKKTSSVLIDSASNTVSCLCCHMVSRWNQIDHKSVFNIFRNSYMYLLALLCLELIQLYHSKRKCPVFRFHKSKLTINQRYYTIEFHIILIYYVIILLLHFLFHFKHHINYNYNYLLKNKMIWYSYTHDRMRDNRTF